MIQRSFPVAILLAGCLEVSPRQELKPLAPAPAPAPAAPAPQGAEEHHSAAPLDGEIDLQSLIAEALERNPDLDEARLRAEAAGAWARGAGGLDDPVFKAETEGVPWSNPAAFDRAMDNMFGLSQTFPFPGKLALRSREAEHEASALEELRRAREYDLVARLRRAYAEYYLIIEELSIHREHVKLLAEFEDIARQKFQNGAIPQKDVLRAQLEAGMLHSDVLEMENHIGSARATLNALLSRPASAPLGKPRPPEVTLEEPAAATVEAARVASGIVEEALAARPDLRALRERAQAAQAGAELARRDALLPDVMLSADYWQIPGGDDAWGGSVSINLPWLTGKRSAERRRREIEARAEERMAQGGENLVRYEVESALLHLRATRGTVLLLQGELLPKARQQVEVTRSSYVNDRASFLELIEAERALRDLELKHRQALAAHETALADLDRATGRPWVEKSRVEQSRAEKSKEAKP